jgi:hypothetical protein
MNAAQDGKMAQFLPEHSTHSSDAMPAAGTITRRTGLHAARRRAHAGA